LTDESEKTGGHFYDPGMSISAKNLRKQASIQFVGAEMSGTFFMDDIRVGGAGDVLVKDVVFGKVDKSSFFSGKTGDLEAVIGMGYPALAEENTVSLTDEMKTQKVLENALFAFYLSTPMMNPGKEPELTFGYYDTEKYKGSLDWHPVVEQYMFLVKLDDVKING
jgi:hypothetical protein